MKLAPDQLRDFASRYTAAWCSRTPASVAAFFSPNGSLTINDSTPAIGRAAITDAARAFMSAFPDLRVSADDLILEGDRIEYHWTLNGTNTGRDGTGHRVRISGFEQWKIGDDGLIEESLGHFDAADYQHQIRHGVPKT